MYNIDKIIQDWCNECSTICMTKTDYDKKTVTIITNRPGIMIGYKGNLVNKYKEEIKEYGWKINIIEAQEIHYPGNNWEDIIDERVKGYFEWENCL